LSSPSSSARADRTSTWAGTTRTTSPARPPGSPSTPTRASGRCPPQPYYGSFESIVDTGTTLIVAPTSDAEDYFDSIGAEARTYSGTVYGAYDCNSPPPVSFSYGGKRIALDSQAITIGTDDDGACLLSVVGEDTGLNAWISGDAFLRNTLAIFDRSNNRVGFATRSAGPQ